MTLPLWIAVMDMLVCAIVIFLFAKELIDYLSRYIATRPSQYKRGVLVLLTGECCSFSVQWRGRYAVVIIPPAECDGRVRLLDDPGSSGLVCGKGMRRTRIADNQIIHRV